MNALDKEEFRIKLEEINKLVQDKVFSGLLPAQKVERVEELDREKRINGTLIFGSPTAVTDGSVGNDVVR